MQTQIVKTTMYLPNDLHELLREEAYRERKSINRLVIEKLNKKKKKEVFKIKPFEMNVVGNLGRREIYNEVLEKHAQ